MTSNPEDFGFPPIGVGFFSDFSLSLHCEFHVIFMLLRGPIVHHVVDPWHFRQANDNNKKSSADILRT